mgnify:CR=1
MDVLILGMGTGTYATQCKKYFGDMNMRGTGEGNINEYLSDTISSVLEPYRSAAENLNASSGRKVRHGTFVLYGQRRVNMV